MYKRKKLYMTSDKKKIEKIVDDLRLIDDDLMSKVFDEKDNRCIQLSYL